MSTSNALTIHIVADYGPMHDLAFAEVKQRIRHILGEQRAILETYAVPAFDTLATGFVLAQIARNHLMPGRHVFYVNTAPRKDNLAARTANEGERLVYARLRDNVEVLAVNSGYSLSFLANAATTLRATTVDAHGSQFRSRDVFPQALGKLVRGEDGLLAEAINPADMPTPPAAAVCYTDGYGNLKTSLQPADVAHLRGQRIALTLNGIRQDVTVADGIFSVSDGELVLAAGSSGWQTADGGFRSFMEISLRGGSAAEAFGGKVGGQSFQWQALQHAA